MSISLFWKSWRLLRYVSIPPTQLHVRTSSTRQIVQIHRLCHHQQKSLFFLSLLSWREYGELSVTPLITFVSSCKIPFVIRFSHSGTLYTVYVCLRLYFGLIYSSHWLIAAFVWRLPFLLPKYIAPWQWTRNICCVIEAWVRGPAGRVD
jgi:hypothetical protein